MRFILGFLGIIAILILIIVLIVRGGGDNGGSKAIDLADYITSSSQVQLTKDGTVSAAQTHASIRISVTENEATLTVVKGYEGQIVRSKSYANNPNSYTNFMLSLKRAGYTLGDANKDFQDERGRCALGTRFIYELNNDGRRVQRYWSTSCDKTATFKGNPGLVQRLFELQIPDYDSLTNDVDLAGGSSLFG
jgi:hypothetical protein